MLYRSILIISTVNYINYIHYHQSSQWLPLARSHGRDCDVGAASVQRSCTVQHLHLHLQWPPPPPPPPPANTRELMAAISACDGLTGLPGLTPQQQQAAIRRSRNIFIVRNIEIKTSQLVSSHCSLSPFNSCFVPSFFTSLLTLTICTQMGRYTSGPTIVFIIILYI